MVAVLGVTGAMTRGSEWYRDRWFRSRCREVAVHFDDWLVDGVPLRRLVSSRRGGEVVEQMTLLDHERQNPEETMRYLARLSGHGEPAFEDGRGLGGLIVVHRQGRAHGCSGCRRFGRSRQ